MRCASLLRSENTAQGGGWGEGDGGGRAVGECVIWGKGVRGEGDRRSPFSHPRAGRATRAGVGGGARGAGAGSARAAGYDVRGPSDQ